MSKHQEYIFIFYFFYFLGIHFLKIFLFIYLFLAVFCLCCCTDFSLAVVSGGYPLAPCTAGASHCGDFSCWRAWALGHVEFSSCNSKLQSKGSIVVVHGFSCFNACGIFPDQGLNLWSLPWQVNSYPLCHQGSPLSRIFALISQKGPEWKPLILPRQPTAPSSRGRKP